MHVLGTQHLHTSWWEQCFIIYGCVITQNYIPFYLIFLIGISEALQETSCRFSTFYWIIIFFIIKKTQTINYCMQRKAHSLTTVPAWGFLIKLYTACCRNSKVWEAGGARIIWHFTRQLCISAWFEGTFFASNMKYCWRKWSKHCI